MNVKLTVPLLLCSLLIITACIIRPVLPIPPDNPSLAAVQNETSLYKNRQVTWGGMIIGTEVKQNETWVTILAKPLDSYAQPVQTNKSLGRFIGIFSGFRDPAIFSNGRYLTLTGKTGGTQTRKIDELSYIYPLVQVEQSHLWPVRVRGDWDDYDYWYDPWYPFWYDPWYPYYYPRSYFYFQHRQKLE